MAADSHQHAHVADSSVATAHGPVNDGFAALSAFQQLWLSGTPPVLEAFVATVGPLSDDELVAILRCDMTSRWAARRSLPVEWYLQRFGQIQSHSDLAVDLIYTEFLLREKHGQTAGAEEFLLRFSEYAETLADQFALHQAIQEDAFGAAADDVEIPRPGEGRTRLPDLPGYQIVAEIGRGGIGVVYQAWDLQLHRIVALKVLLSGAHASSAQLQRFYLEAEAAARLQHPHIVQVFEIGEHDGSPYLAMEYVHGGSLADRTAGKFQPPRWSAIVVEQLARSVAFAHQHGVIHRDLKPGNVLLVEPPVPTGGSNSSDNTPGNRDTPCGSTETASTTGVHTKITDFGLAKIASTPLAATCTGDILGTPGYMAPEQAAGRTHEIDVTADVYSLGAILYDLLTGRAPFVASTPAATIRQLMESEPVALTKLVPGIPRDLQTICLKCLEKEPRRRYATATELANDLARYLADTPIQARPVTSLERFWKLCRRNPVIASLCAIVAVLGVTLAVGALVADWIRKERDLAVVNQVRAEQAERAVQVRAHIAQAGLYRRRGGMGLRASSLNEIEKALRLDPPEELRTELRNEIIASLALSDLTPAMAWECPDAVVAVHPAFDKYAHGSGDGSICVRRIADNHEIIRVRRPTPPDSRFVLKFSPDGNYLASFTFDHHLIVWDVRDGAQVLDDPGCAWDYAFDFTSDSQCIVSGHAEEVVIYELATAAIKASWPVDFAVWRVSCGPDIDQFAISPIGSPSPHRLLVLSCSTGKIIAELKANHWVYDIAWHPDGKTMAFGSGDTHVYLWKIGERMPYRKLAAAGIPGVSVAFSHSGDLLAGSDWGGGMMVWDVATGTRLCSAKNSLAPPCFSPDDRYLGSNRKGTSVGIYGLNQSPIFRQFLRHGQTDDESLKAGALSPDGRLLVVGSDVGLTVWDAATTRELAFAPISNVRWLAFTDSGELITLTNELQRWPVRTSDPISKMPGSFDGDRRQVVIGPPVTIPIDATIQFGINHDGSVLVATRNRGSVIMRASQPNELVSLGPHEDGRYVDITRDGTLVATGSHFGSKVKVWNALDGQLVISLPVETSSLVQFSPDQRWLATSGGGSRLWRVGTWESLPPVEGLICGFSPDSRMMAVESDYGSVRLLDPESGHEFAELQHPFAYSSNRYIFSPDQSLLIGVNTFQPLGFAWDLRRVREELSARGLDHDWPTPLNQTDPLDKTSCEVKISWEAHASNSSTESLANDIARCREILKSNPDDARTCNELAWMLSVGPVDFRDADEAAELAERAVSQSPNDVNYTNTLGVAYYRAGRFREAADQLAANLSKQSDDSLPYDLFFLAMSYHRLGETSRAHDYLVWANRWTDAVLSHADINANLREEVKRIEDEAHELMLNEPSPDS